ncbi:MAG: translation initiation factor IF-2 [Patescibacteria group bacterium]
MSLQSRPPVVTIMGHVDHGKTSLLDYIRKTKVAAGEAGGITQHVGAYQAEHKGKKITFIDTPGHAAFSKMRSRGAAVTDIVILVVAADDGVKPQTVESIQHIQAANVPVIVAITKVDLPTASAEMVKAQLTEHGISVNGYGGDVDAVEISVKTGKGVDDLLETIQVMAELNEITADPAAPLNAIVIESVRDAASGAQATVLVKEGTLNARDMVYTLTASGKVKRMTDALGKTISSATPSMPAVILGFESTPMVGEVVTTTPSTEVAEDIAVPTDNFSLESILNQNNPKLNLIIKSDTVGTLQALQQQLTEEVLLVSSGVGAITETDVLLAETTHSQIMGFNVKYTKTLQKLAEERDVRVKVFKIIYELLENLQKQVLKIMEPTIDEEVVGEATISQIFDMKGERIAGVKITKGKIKKTDLVHLKRADIIIADPKIKTMQHGKDQIEKAEVGEECGIVFTRFSNLQVGDVVSAYIKKDD